jgi:hypothetical protein
VLRACRLVAQVATAVLVGYRCRVKRVAHGARNQWLGHFGRGAAANMKPTASVSIHSVSAICKRAHLSK